MSQNKLETTEANELQNADAHSVRELQEIELDAVDGGVLLGFYGLALAAVVVLSTARYG